MPEQYKVQKIIDKEVRNGKIYYKVKWQDYPEDQSTWEPEKNLSTVKDMVQEFNQKLARAQRNNSKNQSNGKPRVYMAVKSANNNKNIPERETSKKSTKKKPVEEESEESNQVEQDEEHSEESEVNYKRPMPSNLKRGPPPRKTAAYSRPCVNTNSQKFLQSEETQQKPKSSPILSPKGRIRNETESCRLQVMSMMKSNDNESYFQVSQNGKTSVLKRKQLLEKDPLALVQFYESHMRFLPTK